MKSYLITYNCDQQSHFAYTATVEEARSYVVDLLTRNQIMATDSLSIIRMSDEQIIFFKANNLTPDCLYVQPQRRSPMFNQLKALIYGGMTPVSTLTHQPV